MSSISSRTQARSHLLQRMANNWPPSSRARLCPTSTLQQMLHGLDLTLFETAVEIERAWHNFFIQSVDPRILDTIWHTKWPFAWGILEVYDGDPATNSPVTPMETQTTLYDFWYTRLPTRLTFLRHSSVMLGSERASTAWQNPGRSAPYMVGSHYQTSYIDATATSVWGMISAPGLSTLTASDTIGWGGGPALVMAADSSLATYSASSLSPSSVTGRSLLWAGQWRHAGTQATSLTLTVGYDGVGSATKTIPLPTSTQWHRYFVAYQPPASTSTGYPYVRVDYEQATNIANSYLYLSDQSLMDLEDAALSTSHYTMRGWLRQDIRAPFVTVSGATNMLSADDVEGRPTIPATLVLEGIDGAGRYVEERMVLPYNGTHQALHSYLDITGIRVDAMYPDSAQLSVQWQNYLSVEGVPNTLGLLTTPLLEAPLFYGLERRIEATSTSSYLKFQAHVSDNPLLVSAGYDALLDYYKIELQSESTQPVDLTDIQFDVNRQVIYALCTSDTSIKIYDALSYWPGSSSLRHLRNRTVNPALQISPLDVSEYYLPVESSITWEIQWLRRERVLLSNRWILHKPSTSVGLVLGGGEAVLDTHGWNTNYEVASTRDGEFRFTPQAITYTATEYGDYALQLEARFFDENGGGYITERDVVVFSVPRRTPLKSLSLPVQTSTSQALGIELDGEGMLRVAFSDGAPLPGLSLREEIYKPRYDYFFQDTARGRVYFQEPYHTVRFTK